MSQKMYLILAAHHISKGLGVVHNLQLLFSQESSLLPTLRKHLRKNEKRIKNLLPAIEEGALTSSTKARLAELDACKESLEISIAQESIRRPTLTCEQIVFWLVRYHKGDVHISLYQRSIIDCLVSPAYLYNGKIVLTNNYKDGTQTISPGDVQAKRMSIRCAVKLNQSFPSSTKCNARAIQSVSSCAGFPPHHPEPSMPEVMSWNIALHAKSRETPLRKSLCFYTFCGI